MRINRTYRIDETIPKRVQNQASHHNISISDTVNFLLLFALEELESNHITIPTKQGKAVVDWQKVFGSSDEVQIKNEDF